MKMGEKSTFIVIIIYFLPKVFERAENFLDFVPTIKKFFSHMATTHGRGGFGRGYVPQTE